MSPVSSGGARGDPHPRWPRQGGGQVLTRIRMTPAMREQRQNSFHGNLKVINAHVSCLHVTQIPHTSL